MCIFREGSCSPQKVWKEMLKNCLFVTKEPSTFTFIARRRAGDAATAAFVPRGPSHSCEVARGPCDRCPSQLDPTSKSRHSPEEINAIILGNPMSRATRVHRYDHVLSAKSWSTLSGASGPTFLPGYEVRLSFETLVRSISRSRAQWYIEVAD